MTKNELIKKVTRNTDYDKHEIGLIVDEIVDQMEAAIIAGEKITFPGFMTIEPYIRKSRPCRHPSTGELMLIPPVKSVKVKLSTTFKEVLKEGLKS